MTTHNQVTTHSNIILNSFEKLESLMGKIKFPNNLSVEERMELHSEIERLMLKEEISQQEAQEALCPPHFMGTRKALSGFTPINTKDNDKRKREKKVNIRIVYGKNQSKYVVLSPGLMDLVDYPEHLSFYAKDNVLAIGEDLPMAKDYEVYVGQYGYMINSESLVDYLCNRFKLLNRNGSMTSNSQKPFKSSFSDYTTASFKMGEYLYPVVFMYLPPNR